MCRSKCNMRKHMLVTATLFVLALLVSVNAFQPIGRIQLRNGGIPHACCSGLRAARGNVRAVMQVASLLPAVVPLVSVAESVAKDKRLLYTAIYTAAHLPIIVPFLLFWKVDVQTKVKGALFATPLFVGWIALLGGWIRF